MGIKPKYAGAVGCFAALLLAGCAAAPSFSEDEKLQMRDSTSDYQRAVLNDLVVTETEYRDAVDATRTCLRDKGFGIGPLEQNDNQLGFQSSYDGTNGPSDRIMQDCNDEYMTEVGPIWLSQREPLTQ